MLFGLAIEIQKFIFSRHKSETGATICQMQIGSRGDMFKGPQTYFSRVAKEVKCYFR